MRCSPLRFCNCFIFFQNQLAIFFLSSPESFFSVALYAPDPSKEKETEKIVEELKKKIKAVQEEIENKAEACSLLHQEMEDIIQKKTRAAEEIKRLAAQNGRSEVTRNL